MIGLRNLVVTTLAIGITLTSVDAFAFGLGDVPGAGAVVGGSGSKGAAVDVNALVTQGKGLMGKFNSAFSNILAAESRTLAALGQKELADKADASAKFYAAGNVADSDQLKRDIAISDDAKAAIDAETAKGVKLDAEGKKHLATAVPHYAKSIVETAGLPGEFQNWAQSTQAGIASLSSNPMDVMKLKDGVSAPLTVATNMPDLMSKFGSTTKNFVSFAQTNDVDVKDVAGKLGGL